MFVLAALPIALPINSEPVCRIRVLVPVPVKFTDTPPSILPAFLTVPEPWIAATPPLMVAPKAFVTSSKMESMPYLPPAMIRSLLTVALLALMAIPFTAFA